MSCIKTKTGENTITFDAFYQYIWARNYGDVDVYISNHSNIVAGDDDVALLPAGEAVRLTVNGKTLYVLGSTTLEVHAQNFSDSPFAWNEAGEGGGSDITVVSLSATENTTYTAPTGTAYSPVTVSVSPNVGTKSITENGIYTASSDNLDGYSSVTVDTGIYTGTTTPASALGKDGDYYYLRHPNIINGIDSGSSSGSASSQLNLGYEFTLSESVNVVAIRVYVRANGHPTKGYLIDIDNDSAVLVQTDEISSEYGWNTIRLSAPITLQANHKYAVLTSMQDSYGTYRGVSSVTPTQGLTVTRGCYGNIASLSFDNSNIYLADIGIDTGDFLISNEYRKKNGSWVQI